MKSDAVPHSSFREGFVVGYQIVKGTVGAVPASPAVPAPRAGTSSFLLVAEAGVEAAGGRIIRAWR